MIIKGPQGGISRKLPSVAFLDQIYIGFASRARYVSKLIINTLETCINGMDRAHSRKMTLKAPRVRASKEATAKILEQFRKNFETFQKKRNLDDQARLSYGLNLLNSLI